MKAISSAHRRLARGGALVAALCCALALSPAVARAGSPAQAATLPVSPAERILSMEIAETDPWKEALRLEQAGEVPAAAAQFERIAASGGSAEACWRASRSYWRVADALPRGEEEERIATFERASTWAGHGMERDPECGECALWKYAALGRLTEHYGMVWGGRKAREMQSLLDRGIALKPQHRDPNGNVALANLYYASAVFHRMVPEWFWLPVVFGVKGDTDRALSDIRSALAISSHRIDYQVEHGAVLLCQGLRRNEADRTTEGLGILRASLRLTPTLPTDPVDQDFARQLLGAPEKACGFSRRGFIDVEGEGRRVAVGVRK